MDTNPMWVILRINSLKAYVAAPKNFHVLGIVRFGLEFGLLATNAAGQYFRVNGSQSVALDGAQVGRAIAISLGRGGRCSAYTGTPPVAGGAAASLSDAFLTPPAPLAPVAPYITIRKHRHVAIPALQDQQGLHVTNA